ncbi:MAG TPA: YdcF family protein [Candidatus Sulfotelmatobacter sp.]|jgi:hypothetical protein
MTSPRIGSRILAFAVLLALLVFAAKAGKFLVVDQPRPSDVILVLAGETDSRPHLALELLNKHFAKSIILDVPAKATIFEFSELQLAQKYIQDLPQPGLVRICPIDGLSTKEESKGAEKCLRREGAKSVLIVTSDFHTHRALAIFRHELPSYRFSVAAAHSDEGFGAKWWTHRQWAKTFLDEWMRLLWWDAIDRWR